jgi:hypothetical protein
LDATIEAAQEVYKDNHDGLMLEQDELSGWLGSMDKYSGHSGGLKDRGFWLVSFNGDEYWVDRVKRGTFLIPNLSSSILGGIQPEGISKAAADGVDDGLIQRFFMIILKRATIDRDDELDIVNAKYGTLVELLYKMQAANVVQFTSGAQNIRDELARKDIELQCLEGVNKKLSAHIGKYDGMFARLALLFHCIEHAEDDRLDLKLNEDTAQRAADFLHKFLLPHALAFYGGVLNLADNHERISKVAGFILAHKIPELDNCTIQRGDRTMRKLEKWETDKICETFEARGWAIEIPSKTRIRRWSVNPRIHTMFTERAKQEAEQRAAIHKIMQNLKGK